jgi:hypothetical protein
LLTGWNAAISFIGIYLFAELLMSLIKKFPLWITSKIYNPYIIFFKETVFIRKILKTRRFFKWDDKFHNFGDLTLEHFSGEKITLSNLLPEIVIQPIDIISFGAYVALSKIIDLISVLYRIFSPILHRVLRSKFFNPIFRVGSNVEVPSSEKTKSDSISVIDNTRQSVILGKPGCGKTASMEFLYYKVAKIAYKKIFSKWLVLNTVCLLLLFINPYLSVLWVILFSMHFRWIAVEALPIFLEGSRLSYDNNEDLDDWLRKFIEKSIGIIPPRWDKKAIFFIDAINEMKYDEFNFFIDAWQKKITDDPATAVIFTSRMELDPSCKMGTRNTFTICDLNETERANFRLLYGQKIYGPNFTLEAATAYQNEFSRIIIESDLLKSPYWVNLLMNFGPKSRNKAELLLAVSKKVIENEIENKPVNRRKKYNWTPIPINIEMDALACLANDMATNGRYSYNGETEWELAINVLGKRFQSTPYKALDAIGEAESAILIKHEYRQYLFFSHQLLKDFYAAYYLQSSNFVELFIKESKNLHSWNILLFLIELTELVSYDSYKGYLEQISCKSYIYTHVVFAFIGLIFNSRSLPAEFKERIKPKILTVLVKNINKHWEDHNKLTKELVNLLGPDAIELNKELLNNPQELYQMAGKKLLELTGNIRFFISLLSHNTKITKAGLAQKYKVAGQTYFDFFALKYKQHRIARMLLLKQSPTKKNIWKWHRSPKNARPQRYCQFGRRFLLNKFILYEVDIVKPFVIEKLITYGGVVLDPIIDIFRENENKDEKDLDFEKISGACKVLEGLGNIGAKGLLDYFQSKLNNREGYNFYLINFVLFERLLYSLVSLTGKETLPISEKIYYEANNKALKKSIISLLSDTNDDDCLSFIKRVADDKYEDDEVRFYAREVWEDKIYNEIEKLIFTDPEKAIKKLNNLLTKDLITRYSFYSKRTAIFLLDHFFKNKGIDEIIPFIDKEDNLTCKSAIEILGELGIENQSAINAISKVIQNKDDFIKLFAIKALGKIGDADSIKTIKVFVRNETYIPNYGKISDESKNAIRNIRSRISRG